MMWSHDFERFMAERVVPPIRSALVDYLRSATLRNLSEVHRNHALSFECSMEVSRFNENRPEGDAARESKIDIRTLICHCGAPLINGQEDVVCQASLKVPNDCPLRKK